MSDLLKQAIFYLSISLMFILGFCLIISSIYISNSRGWSITSGIFVIVGLSLIVISIVMARNESDTVIVRGEEYGFKQNPRDDVIEQVETAVTNAITDIPDLADDSGKIYSEKSGIDPLQFTIDELNKQIAVKKYLQDISNQEGLKIVQVEGTSIRAASENNLNLATGLMFNVFLEKNDVSERIATAELTESESTTGKLFEFEIREWKYDESEKIGEAKSDLADNLGWMKIITEGVVDTDIQDLRAAREQIVEMKNTRDTKYETQR